MPNGKQVRFILRQLQIMDVALALKFPMIQTYSGFEVANPENTGRFDITPQGFHASFNQQEQQYYIDPVTQGNREVYRVYNATQALATGSKRMGDEALFIHSSQKLSVEKSSVSFGSELLSYRLAVSATGEYTQFHQGTISSGLAAIVTAINRVNQIFEKDVAIRFVLVANNEQIIYTNSSTDPFDNSASDISVTQGVIDSIIGNANYDIGHVFGTGAGGVAGVGVVCGNSKALGVTGLPSPINDIFYVDFVSHEIGHQLSARHIFNGGVASCFSNRTASSAYEPGSGSTIMSYAGSCGTQNLQNSSDAYFHSHSIEQMRTFVTQGGGSVCGTSSLLNNTPPGVSAGDNFVIPVQTPFVLSGAGNDIDSVDMNRLSYTWEQLDLGPQTTATSQMIDDGLRPLFRTYSPVSSAERTLPQPGKVIAGSSSFDEVLPTTSRALNFQLTVRDGRGGVNMATMSVLVDNSAGPFLVTSPQTNVNVNGGTPFAVNWNVANTDSSSVNCQQVDISLSDNGGVSFDYPALDNTANDGSETITLPGMNTLSARVKVSCSNNHFFNISPVNFSVVTVGVPVITSQSSLTTTEEQPVTILLSNINVSDSNNNFPDDFSLLVLAGEHYTFNGNIVTPAKDFDGLLDVNIKVNDGVFDSPVYVFQINVANINDPPSIQSTVLHLAGDEDTLIEISLSALNILDVDSNHFSLIIMNGENYTVAGNHIKPDANFNGSLTVEVKVNDGEFDSNVVQIDMLINPVNDEPIAVADAISVEQNSIGNLISVLSNDSDIENSNELSITGFTYQGNSKLGISDDKRKVSYTPASGFSGSEVVLYHIQDAQGGKSSASLSITVIPQENSGGGVISFYLVILLFFPVILQQATLFHNRQAP